MKDLDNIHAQNPDQGFQFPGVFEITAMGSATCDLEQKVPRLIEGIGLAVLAGSVRVRPATDLGHLGRTTRTNGAMGYG
jgi:putative lipoic acid-binding regulatory protein